MTNCIGAVYTENETKLSWSIKADAIVKKTKQNNDMTNCASTVYVEKKTKLSWSIRPSATCDDN